MENSKQVANGKRFYRVPELSQISGIPRASLYAAIQRHEIKAMKLASAIYIPAAEVARLLGEEPTGDDPAAEKAVAAAH